MKDAQTLLRELSYWGKFPVGKSDDSYTYMKAQRELESHFPEIYAAYILRESLLNYSMIAIPSVQEPTIIAQLLNFLNEKLKFEPDTPKTLFKEEDK